MPIYSVTGNESIVELLPIPFAEHGWKERGDLQRLLRDAPDVLEPGLFVIAEEYGNWADSRRRIDLLALDSTGRLVVIELKRTEDGGFMDLQAVRYAAMVANMTFEQAVEAHAHYLTTRGLTGDAEARLLAHLHAGDSRPELNSGRPRIMLVAGGFSAELTTSVLWLNDSDLDLTCVKVQLYRLGEEEVLNVEQIIPLPEAQDYMVQLRKKVEESESTLYPEVPWTYEDIAVLRQSISNPHLVALFDLCSRRPGEFVAMSEVVAQSGQTPAQARGAMGGFTTLVRGRFKRGNWPIDAEWNAGGDYQAYYRLSPEIAGWWRQAGETSPATPPGVASDLTVVESL